MPPRVLIDWRVEQPFAVWTASNKKGDTAAVAGMQLSKYLILLHQGVEQAIAFPAHVKHQDIWDYIRRESPAAKVLSAGFFADEPEGFWHGGVSETLKLASRPQDGLLIQRMTRSRDRRNWDLRVLVWEACEAARRAGPNIRAPELAMSL
jgi:hypothetical protein